MDALNLKTCALCSRIYSEESRYLRHVRYCRRAKDQRKGRPKSCVACSASKVKCSFSSPCSRCDRKGLRCVYQGNAGQQPGAYQQLQSLGDEITVTDLNWEKDDVIDETALVTQNINVHEADQGNDTAWMDGTWLNFPEANAAAADIETLSLTIDIEGLSSEEGTATLDPQLDLSPLAVFPASNSTTQPSSLSSLDQSPPHSQLQTNDDHQYDYIYPPKPTSTDLTHLRHGSPVLKHAASLIMHMACSFPQMMLRRSIFPPFIHPRWHEPRLPDTIAACMGIAQLFAARTPETRAFMWRTIFAEAQGFRDELARMSRQEVQHAMQAMMVYMLMAVVDRDAETPRRGAKLVNMAGAISTRFLQLVKGEYYSMTEKERPSESWEDWIFAETRRRMTCLWYILSRVIAIDVGIPCKGCPALDELALPSSRTLWEARTREEWEAEKSAYDTAHPITTMGELSMCRGGPGIDTGMTSEGHDTVSTQQRLMSWEAGADKMAIMMNIVIEFN